MKRIIFLIIAIFLVGAMVIDQTGWAKAGFLKSKLSKRRLEVKGSSPENPIVFLGSAKDKKSSETVEGVAIVHYAKNYGKAIGSNAKGACYTFLVQGAKWKALEPWIVDPQNKSGLDKNFILANVSYDIAKWEKTAKKIRHSGRWEFVRRDTFC